MEWHYAVGDERRGPVDENTLGTLIGSGVVRRDSLVWRSGMPDWQAASRTELSKFFPDQSPALARPSQNPYAAPSARSGQAEAGEASGAIEARGVAFAVIMSIVTFGFFWFYLAYVWARDINTILGREKHVPALPPILTLVTCGIASIVYTCIFGYDLEEAAKRSGLEGRTENFGVIILALTIGGFILGLASGGLLSLVCSLVTIGLIQAEFNKFAARGAVGEYAS